jgi:tetratricopeptide (TPR) repeat protein
MGRYEEALMLYRRAAEIEPDRSVVRINLASAGRTLGMHELADSAVSAMAAAGEPFDNYMPQRLVNAIYAERYDDVESLIERSDGAPDASTTALLHIGRATLFATRGRVSPALAQADSAVAVFDGMDAGQVALMARLATAGVAMAAESMDDVVARFAQWDIEGTLRDAPLTLHMAFGLYASVLARAGRTADAERVLHRADSLAKTAGFHQPGAIENARAGLALARGDATAALAHIERAVAADFGMLRHEHRMTRALALDALGRYGEASREWAALASSKGLFWMDSMQYPALLPLAHERAGRAFLAAGDTASALRHLAAFTQMWANADAALQPRVRAATETIRSIQRIRG